MGNAQWVAIGQVGRIALQLISLAVLARLLEAQQYGVMAMATVVTNFALLMRDLGTGAAVVQSRKLSDELLDSVFWLNLSMGGALALILGLGAVPISHLFGSAELPPVLWALAVVFPITASATTHQALLERRSQFKALAQIELTALTLGVVCAVGAAAAGWGVFSLVVQAIVNAVVSTLLLWKKSLWRPGRNGSLSELRGLLGFSGNLSLFQFINYFSRNADGMIIGRFLGATALGFYSMAYRLMLFPVQSLTSVASRALYPIMSQKQTCIADMATLYLRTITLIATITAPLMAGLFSVREAFVTIAFGPGWGLVGAILMWLAPAGFLQSIMSSTGAIFMARGRTDLMMRVGVLTAITQLSAFAIGAQYDVLVLAALYSASNLLNFVPVMLVTLRQLDSSLADLAKVLAAPVASSVVMAAAVRGVVWACEREGLTPLLTLAVACPFGVAVYLAVLTLVFRRKLTDLRALLRRPR
jgi:O-antigen/teichoic acid export membrane protein